MKWECTNCGEEFESEDGCELDEFKEHVFTCFNVMDFFKLRSH